MEESICGHATIAAHYARALEKKLGSTSVRQKTGVGILPVDINKIGNDYRIVMTQGKIQFGSIIQDGLKEDIYRSLNICQHDIHENFPLQVVSTGNGKLIVGLRNNEKLHVLQPDMDKVTKISTELDVSGFYVFTMHNDDPLIHGRMFAPAYGVNEDPATGNANSALGAYLVHHNLFHIIIIPFTSMLFKGRQ